MVYASDEPPQNFYSAFSVKSSSQVIQWSARTNTHSKYIIYIFFYKLSTSIYIFRNNTITRTKQCIKNFAGWSVPLTYLAVIQQRTAVRWLVYFKNRCVGRRIIPSISNAYIVQQHSPSVDILEIVNTGFHEESRSLFGYGYYFVFGDWNALSVIVIFTSTLSLFACLGALNDRRYVPYSATLDIKS